MKTTLLFLSVLVFVSCSNNDSQIEELQNQTKKLEKRIDQLQPNDSKNNEISEIKTKELINEIDDTKQSDFDEKEIGDCELYDLLNEDCVATTETNKGSHYYIYIHNVPKYKCETKVLVDKVESSTGAPSEITIRIFLSSFLLFILL